jgi:lipopolysaccharide export system permease protein
VIAFGKLGRYFGYRFSVAVFGVFTTCVGLIAFADFFENTRRLGGRAGVDFTDITLLVLLRLPSFTEQLLPFAVLLGAMGTFLTLSRQLEMVVARAAGMSVWQFTGSAITVAFLIGVFAVVVYNPMSAAMKERANDIEASFTNKTKSLFQTSEKNIWVRQNSDLGQSIIQARSASDQGRTLTSVKVYAFDKEGSFVERIEADTARLEGGNWVLSNVRLLNTKGEHHEHATYKFPTNLTYEQVRGNLASADSLSFWDLPEAIEMATRAGLRTERYRLQYQVLLARPLLLVAMVIIAAVVCLRVFRLGGVGKMILGGVIAGFGLYVVSRLAEELGESGIIYPAVAAWFPAVFGTLIGCLMLLHQEDG